MKIFLVLRPIERIIGVFGRLRSENKVRVVAFGVLQSVCESFRVCSRLIEQYRSRNVGKVVV